MKHLAWLGLGALLLGVVDATAALRQANHSLLPGDAAAIAGGSVGIALAAAAVPAALVWLATRAHPRLRAAPNVSPAAAGAGAGLLLALVLTTIRREIDPGMATGLAACAGMLVGLVGGAARPWIGPGLLIGAVGISAIRLPDTLVRPTPNAPSASQERLLFISLDTFRADHLGAIGGFQTDVKTPNLDALAAQGRLFTHGVAAVPLTLPSHVAMLSGQTPDGLDVIKNGDVLSDDARTVAQDLHDDGWATGAFVTAYVLRGDTGLSRGFDHYDDRMGLHDALLSGRLTRAIQSTRLLGKRPVQRPGDIAIERALRWLDAQPGKAFAWVHLYDAHGPYAPRAPYDTMYDATSDDAPGNPAQMTQLRETRSSHAGINPVPKDLRVPIANYAGEITWTDHLVGQLLGQLPADMPVVVAADHGESLFEHGIAMNHGSDVYEPALRVPMIVRAPGQQVSGEIVDAPTDARRVADTIRTLAGLPGVKDEGLLGTPIDPDIISYSPAQSARVQLDPFVGWKVAFRRGNVKWIVGYKESIERFNLDVDPGEEHDVAPGDPEGPAFSAIGTRRLQTLQANTKQSAAKSSDTVEALRALGYVD